MPNAKKSYRYTKNDRKFQSKIYRDNPNRQEINRQPQDQRSGFSRNIPVSAPDISWWTIFFLSLLVTGAVTQNLLQNQTEPEDAAAPNLNNSTQIVLEDRETGISSVNNSQNTQMGFFAANTHYSHQSQSHAQHNTAWPLSKILEEDNVAALKAYLKKGNNLFELDPETQSPLLSEYAGKVYTNRIWKYLLNKNKNNGGWKYLEKRPDLLIFHTVRVATLNSNSNLVLLLNKQGLVDEMKPIAAAFNNIAKAIHYSDVEYLENFVNVIPEAKKILADPVMRRRMSIIAEENADKHMKFFIENKISEYEEVKTNKDFAKSTEDFRKKNML